MYQFNKIKLVIWDLDDTFWAGTLSEGGVVIPQAHKMLILRLADVGIISSICSKNDWLPVKAVLDEYGLTEYFVFPSVNWDPKGGRVRQIIADMKLRAENVLFVDDNSTNRGEVAYYCEGIMVAGPEEIPQLIEDTEQAEKTDWNHTRLNQYKLLESKRDAQQSSSSNEAFLFSSNVELHIHKDCLQQMNRICELVQRTNQLNFTKCRSSETELRQLLEMPGVDAGYVTVTDRFGDYGIVGFYAIQDNVLIHFLFSCRTLGMGIEQYVYNHLGRPELSIMGEVISDLSETRLPPWINQGNTKSQIEKARLQTGTQQRILIKGPCDLYQIFPYIAERGQIDTDFSHITKDGVPIESTSHTTHIVEALRLSKKQKELIAHEVPFADLCVYNDSVYHAGYKVVVLSILSDANLGVYRRKKTGEKLAFLEYNHPITDPVNWDGIISGEYYNAGFRFNKQLLAAFAEKYEFIGRNSPEQILENLRYIRKNLPEDCLLIVMLGGELYYEKNTFDAYMDRHLIHREINVLLRNWATPELNVKLLDVNKYLVDQSSFYDHFNHYIKPVYYALAGEMVDMINEHTGSMMHKTTRLAMVKVRLKEMLALLYHKVKKIFSRR